MTTQEALKRSERSQYLNVFQLEDSPWFYVESEEGKICYKCCYVNETEYLCNCGDFARGSKSDSSFKCKHLLAVISSIGNGDSEKVHHLERRRPKLDESFIKVIDDKDFVMYPGLLDVAHQKNLCMVDVDLIQFPSDENKQTAICKATVQSVDGKKFTDIGDANPLNCNSKVAKHLIRMASTRAKARAFRDMDNIGMTCLEELGDLNDVISHEQKKPAQQKKDNVKPFIKPALAVQAPQADVETESQKKEDVKTAPQCENQPTVTENAPIPAEKKPKASKPGNGNGKSKADQIALMSEAQKSALFNLSRRRGISVDDLEKRAQEKYSVPVEQLTSTNAGEFIRYLQQSA